MATLADYRTSLRQLLHDLSDVLYPLTDKDSYINDALNERDQMTGGNRRTLSVAASTTTGTYTYAQLGNANIIDIISIAVIDGQFRWVLGQYSLTRLNALGRTSTQFKDRPVAYAWVGQTVILNVIASSATFTLETDCTIKSAVLVGAADADPVPFPWTAPIPYYAAFRAKLNARRYTEAEYFLDKFREKCTQIPGARVGMLPSAYGRR